jgi:putative CocE/NonD family hydrolase
LRQRRVALAALCLALLSSIYTGFCLAAPTPAAIAQQTAVASTAQLEALSGQYASSNEPDIQVSFYPQDGKLIAESERLVPTSLTGISATEFGFPNSRLTVKFTLDAAGHGTSVEFSDESGTAYPRNGDAVHHVFHDYRRTEVMIPMRDGVRLHAVVLKPADITTPLPFLIQRTPYGVDGTSRDSFFGMRPELARAAYIYVAEDIRGRYKSEGQFVMSRPMVDHNDSKAIDESTDAWDSVDWLLKNVSGNNGRAGFIGTSYPGFLAMAAGIDPHPAVKAISPQAPMIDVWMGDDFFHNGAFRQTYGYDYVFGMEATKEHTDVSYGKNKDGQPRDGYDFFLERGSFADAVKESGVKSTFPTWKLFLDHPGYDAVWTSRAVERHLSAVAVPTLTVGGYYDQEDMWGPQAEYAALEPHDDHHQNFLVLGPWRHGSWALTTRHLGSLQYGESIGKEYRSQIEARFFAHYLKDEPGFDLQDTASFQTGSNTWKRYSHFPPKEAEVTTLHLQANARLAWSDSPAQAHTTYVSDPANPVPYRHQPIQPTYDSGSQWGAWLVEDQRFVTGRKDVAVWTLPALKKDLIVTGEVLADIFASTTGTDNDMVVKLIDQYPGDDADPKMRGYQLMINEEIFRGRYLDSFQNARPLRAGSVREYRFSLHAADHVFKAGHTVMVEIQSTWFPLYDRNPQTFVPNIMTAKPADYKPATITIYSEPDHDSNLQLPLMNACDHIDCF